MHVPIYVEISDEGLYRAFVPGLTIAEVEGEDARETLLEAMSRAALYLECKEPEMLEFEIHSTVAMEE
ncbi:MAG: type II toxin-antitoxin system HicB family antitoxin [Myxococcota bacterium]